MNEFTETTTERVVERYDVPVWLLRDLFAGFALAGLTANGTYLKTDEAADKVADDAYWYADAMLVARGLTVHGIDNDGGGGDDN